MAWQYWAKKKGGGYSPPALTFSSFGSLGTDSNKWSGGVLASSGNIYFVPSTSAQVLKLDPTSDTLSLFGSLGTTSEKWGGGCLAPNGKIYCAPLVSPSVLKIDPDTDTASTFGSGLNTYHSAILAPNGKIYCVPWGATSVLKIDPDTDTVSTFGSFAAGIKWGGGCLAPNGKIYCAPFGSTQILEIDPSTDTTRLFGSISGAAKFFGALTGADGKVYFIPHQPSTGFGQLDPDTDSFSYVGTSYLGYSWGGLVDKNGNLFGITQQVSRTLELYNPENDFSTFYEIPSSDLDGIIWLRGAVFSRTGVAYGVPSNSSKVLKIQGLTAFDSLDYTLPSPISSLSSSSYNRYFNKY